MNKIPFFSKKQPIPDGQNQITDRIESLHVPVIVQQLSIYHPSNLSNLLHNLPFLLHDYLVVYLSITMRRYFSFLFLFLSFLTEFLQFKSFFQSFYESQKFNSVEFKLLQIAQLNVCQNKYFISPYHIE